jgi:hypothetical protein
MQLIDLADVFGGVRQLEADALAVTASRKAAALDDHHLVRHVGMLGGVGDPVDARLRDDVARTELLRHDSLRSGFSENFGRSARFRAFDAARPK